MESGQPSQRKPLRINMPSTVKRTIVIGGRTERGVFIAIIHPVVSYGFKAIVARLSPTEAMGADAVIADVVRTICTAPSPATLAMLAEARRFLSRAA